uniref:glycoside hydrolase family 19 protein n=1 Tax=unclassified Chryseobacterium TaxID=2593645 RepID=UPI00226A2A88
EVEDIEAFYNSKQLFTDPKCPLPPNQKTYKIFTSALNKAMKDYEINTCLRKAHFLAQVQVESDRLNTTIEYASGWDYDHTTHYQAYLAYKNTTDPAIKKRNFRGFKRYEECIGHGHDVKGYGPKYKGRGLLQLTWKDTYQAYFDYLKHPEYITNPNLVANNLENACNASAWYWKYRSQLHDLNIAADRDDVYYINIGVNGGFTHFDVRIKNVKKILELMKVKEQCKNINSLQKELGKYKYSTSKIDERGYGKRNKSRFEKYDDK